MAYANKGDYDQAIADLVVISDGSVVVPFVRITIAPAPKGETQHFGIEPDRLVKIGEGLS